MGMDPRGYPGRSLNTRDLISTLHPVPFLTNTPDLHSSRFSHCFGCSSLTVSFLAKPAPRELESTGDHRCLGRSSTSQWLRQSLFIPTEHLIPAWRMKMFKIHKTLIMCVQSPRAQGWGWSVQPGSHEGHSAWSSPRRGAVCKLQELIHPQAVGPRYQELEAGSWHRCVPQAGCLFLPQHILSAGCNPVWGYFGRTWGFALAVVYSQQPKTVCTTVN